MLFTNPKTNKIDELYVPEYIYILEIKKREDISEEFMSTYEMFFTEDLMNERIQKYKYFDEENKYVFVARYFIYNNIDYVKIT